MHVCTIESRPLLFANTVYEQARIRETKHCFILNIWTDKSETVLTQVIRFNIVCNSYNR